MRDEASDVFDTIPTLVQIAFNDGYVQLLNRRRRKFGGLGIVEARAAAPSEDLTELFERRRAIPSARATAARFISLRESALIDGQSVVRNT